MAYQLAENQGDSIAVPQLVFARLPELEEEWLRVALYVISTGESDPALIARALHLKSAASVRAALTYWKGAGLLVDAHPHQSRVMLAAGNLEQVPRRRLTTAEVTRAAGNDPAIAALVQECQRLMGGTISERDTTILVSLYTEDKMPVDMILLGVAHCVGLGKRSGSYIERRLLDWQRNGITTGEAAEQYLNLLAVRDEHEHEVAELMELPSAQFTRVQAREIASWYEELKFDRAMIAEAVATAGPKKDVRYIGGILKRWYTEGKRTVKDVIAQSNLTAQNVQPVSAENPNAKRVLKGVPRRVPEFKKNEV